MKKLALLLVVASLFMASPVMAYDGNFLLKTCNAYLKVQARESSDRSAQFCIGYIVSFIDAIYQATQGRGDLPESVVAKMQPEQVDAWSAWSAWSAWKENTTDGEPIPPEVFTTDTTGNQFYNPDKREWVDQATYDTAVATRTEVEQDLASNYGIAPDDSEAGVDPNKWQPSPGNVGGQYILDADGNQVPVSTNEAGQLVNSQTGEPIAEAGDGTGDSENPFGMEWHPNK